MHARVWKIEKAEKDISNLDLLASYKIDAAMVWRTIMFFIILLGTYLKKDKNIN